MDASKLTPLTEAETGMVRDIWMPVEIEDGAANVAADSAIAWLGDGIGRRLFTTGDASVLRAVAQLVGDVADNVRDGIDAFRANFAGSAYRAQVAETIEGSAVSLRKIPDTTPLLSDLRMNPVWRTLLMSPALLSGGLLLFSAPQGQGKTTSASATVRSRLEAWNGVALTVEDPCEMPLHGIHGRGVCIQHSVRVRRSKDGGQAQGSIGSAYYEALIRTLREFPAIGGGGTILFVGEIRDADTAAEYLKAGANGHLAIGTIHAKTLNDALRRLVNLASGSHERQSEDSVRESIADTLAGVFHQRLVWDSKDGVAWERARVDGEMLWSGDSGSVVAQALRDGNMKAIASLSAAQKREARAMPDSISADEAARQLASVKIDT